MGVGGWGGVRRVTTGEHKCNNSVLPVVPYLSLKTGVLQFNAIVRGSDIQLDSR